LRNYRPQSIAGGPPMAFGNDWTKIVAWAEIPNYLSLHLTISELA
jgi:hypothetical protein